MRPKYTHTAGICDHLVCPLLEERQAAARQTTREMDEEIRRARRSER